MGQSFVGMGRTAVAVGLIAVAAVGCGGGAASPNQSAGGAVGRTLPTVAEDRWDRSLAAGETVLVHSGVTVVRKGERATDVARLTSIEDLVVDKDGSVLAVDILGNRLVRVTRDGSLESVTGNGKGTSSGDGGPAEDAAAQPQSVEIAPDGTIWIDDQKGLRRIDATGIITTVLPFNGNDEPIAERVVGQPAATLELHSPRAFALDAQGRPLLAFSRTIFRLEPEGTLTHVAGGGKDQPGEGGPATAAAFESIGAIAVRPDGSILVLDEGARLVREISPTGVITTWGGTVPKVIDRNVGPFSETPHHLALGADGSAIVTVKPEGKVYRVTKSAVAVLTTEVSLPGAIASMKDGSVIVGDELGGLTRVGT